LGPQLVQPLAGGLPNARGEGDERGRAAVAWALSALCQYFRIPFDEKLVLDQVPPPYGPAALAAAAQCVGLDAAWKSRPLGALEKAVAPFVAQVASEAGDSRFAFVLRMAQGRVAFVEQGRAGHAILPLHEFAARYLGQALLVVPRRKPAADPDAPAQPRVPFGFGWFVPELLRQRRIFRDVLLASLAIQLMALAAPLFTQVVIDKVVVHHAMGTLAVVGAGLAIILVFSAAMTWIRQALVLHAGNRIDAVLGLRVFEHLLRLPPRYFEGRPTGVLVARLHGVETIRAFIAGAAVSAILDLPFMGVFVAIMFWYSWQLALVALGLLLAIAALSAGVAPVLRRRLDQEFLLGARNQAFLTEYIAGVETVKSLQMEPQLNARYGDSLAAYLEAALRTRSLANSYQVAAGALEQLMTLCVLCLGAWLVMQESGFTIGMLVAFQMFAGRLSQPVLRLVGLWQEFQQAGIAVRRLGDLMDAPPEPWTAVPARERRRQGRIDIENLAFRHGDDLPWLFRHLDAHIEPGECVAIVGPSGCGKSTLARLLQGFHAPGEGRIRIDGHDIRHLSANELRGSLGVVPQDTVLFSGTIHDNLVLGQASASFEDMVAACKAARVHDAIEALPQGYQTVIGEHGAGLSGGQKQRIAIARALLKRPAILLLDEPTSQLDDETAARLGDTLRELAGTVTIVLITHRIPAALQAVRRIEL
jgi:subfamily B ATP-binding cassette protein HlyB/CyaB